MNLTEPATSNSQPATNRGFWALIITQFQGAFSDNALKWLVIFLITGMGLDAAKRDQLVGIVGALFALPFIVFSMAGGYLADRFSKRTVTIGVKCFEILVMLLALGALAANHIYFSIGCVFLMGVHSAIFGPSKYGLLPELLPEKKLSWGNGVLELGTFLAIIGGTVAAGWLCKVFAGKQEWSGVILFALAGFGLLMSFGITKVPAADPLKKFRANFVADLATQVKLIRRDRALWLAVLGNTYFFAIAALIQFLIVIYATDVLHLTDPAIGSYLQAATAIGIGLGSYAAGHLSGGKIETGLIPLGAIGMTLCSALLGRVGLTFEHVALNLAVLGFFGGFFIVPISALLQHRPDKANKGGVLAAANLLSFVGIFLASGIYYLTAVTLKLSPPTVFLLLAVLTLGATIYVIVLLPDSLLRFVLWCATHSLYRIRVDGRDNIPAKGGALFVCNHVSWVDAVLLIASTDRPVRFVMFKDIYERRWINPFCKILGVIPISSEQRPRELIQSLKAASQAIRDGEVVCIFAEGEITRIGQLLPFRRGMERIMKDVDAPIIPVALDGVAGTPSSFKGGRFVWSLPARIPHPVTVSFGAPLPPATTAPEVRAAVQELVAGAWAHRRERMKLLHRKFVSTARRFPRRFCMADAQTPRLNFGGALVKTIFLARRLRKVWANQHMVGLLLPPSVPGALVNWAALLCGKVPVNLNYTLSESALASCAKQCELQTVITSRAFLEKVKLVVPGRVIYLEDIVGAERRPPARREGEDEPQRAGSETGAPVASGTPNSGSARPAETSPRAEREFGAPGALEKLTALLLAWLMPVRLLERTLASTPHSALRTPHSLDSLATVIFSSGSTGEPKGVMLSHYNIGSNIEQMEQVFALEKHDRVLGVLPFFHSFGFTGTFALPATLGVGVVFHPNPLDSKSIGTLVHHHAVTFLLATPTFLQLYMRGCSPEQFGSVRLVAVGAEKLPDRIAAAFEERFGIRPFEAYGCTECAPAVTVNTFDFRAAGFRQVGAKRGKIGHPLPGVCVRVVDVNNLQADKSVPLGESGLLLVRGPNVMLGYLGKPEKTAEVLLQDLGVRGHDRALELGDMSPSRKAATCRRTPNEGLWYVTGDVAALDEDGFLQITDRLNRFSKIGGEMVPHIKVEEKLHELAGALEQTFVVAGVPDEKKGERLVVLHKLAADALSPVLEKLAASDLPNLWKPRAEQFFRVDAFPLLGTGKLDLRKVKETAQSLSANSAN